MNLKMTHFRLRLRRSQFRLGMPHSQFRLGLTQSQLFCQAVAAGSLFLLTALLPGTRVFADDKKADPPIVPATKCRILCVGDHWVYDLNYRSLHPATPPTQDSAIAALLGLNASDNFRATLDIRVTPYPKDENTSTEVPVNPETSADSAAPDNAPNPDGTASEAPPANSSEPGTASEAGDNDAELMAEAQKSKEQAAGMSNMTLPLSMLIKLQYKKDGQDHTDYVVYYFSQIKSTGKLGLMLSTDSDQKGTLVPGSWGLGNQFETFFPVGSIWYLQPLTSLATIIGTEKVKVKAGEFAAWKVSQKEPETRFNEPELSNYWWYDPSVVFPVKAETSYVNGAKAFITLTTFESTHK